MKKPPDNEVRGQIIATIRANLVNVLQYDVFRFVDDILYMAHGQIEFLGQPVIGDPVKPPSLEYSAVALAPDPFVNQAVELRDW